MTDAQLNKQTITQADLIHLDEDRRYEVVDGALVEGTMAAGYIHLVIGTNLYDLLKPYVKGRKLGRVGTDGLTFILNEDADGVRYARIPDVFFVRAGRLPAGFDRTRPFPGAPDLAVEIVSPSETAAEIIDKVNDYLRFGSQQVWVIYPSSEELHQYISGEQVAHIHKAADTFSVPSLFADLSIRVADLFTDEAG